MNKSEFKESWTKHYFLEDLKKQENGFSKNILEIISGIQKENTDIEKKSKTKGRLAGVIFGASIVSAIGSFGLIFSILGFGLGIWVAKKMLNSNKQYIRIFFWILIVLFFIGGGVIRTIGKELKQSSIKNENALILETDKSSETSELSGNMYRNTKYHFRIKFPEGWKIEIGDGIHIVQKASFEKSTINVMVQQLDLGGNEGFTSIKDNGSSKEFIDTVIEGAKLKFSDIKIIDSGETKIDNEPAYWVEYSATYQVLDKELKMTNLTYFLAKGDTMYSISAGTATNEYQKIKPIFIETISTFVLEDY